MIKRRFGLIMNLSIPARLHTAGALAIAGVLATCYAGYTGLEQSNNGLMASITAASAVRYGMDGDMMHDALRADVLNASVAGPEADDATRTQILADVDDNGQRFLDDMDSLLNLELDAELLAYVETTLPLVKTYIEAARTTAQAELSDRQAGKAALPAFQDLFDQLGAEMGMLSALIEAQGSSAGENAVDQNHAMMRIVLIATGFAVVILLVSNLLISRSITKPLARVKVAIEEVATGNLGGRHSSFERVSDLKDEVSEIARFLEILRIRLREALTMEAEIKRTQAEQSAIVAALSIGLENLSNGNLTQQITEPFSAEYETLRGNFNRTVEQLDQTMTQVVNASSSIRARAEDITQASAELSQRTENQAAMLEETAAALDELTNSVKAAANGAKEVEVIVQSARQEAEDNGKVVLRAVDAMNGIERSSDQISRIIGVIDDIAFQTNLLALNAGVEAARAGDSGKGFAVVASEVRALAQRSSDASKEIKELISSSTLLVGRGVEAVGSAGKALTSLVHRVTHISSLVSGIANSASQQSVALAEVNIGVTQLDQVAQRNAAMVEQSMTATQSLQQEAFGMDRLVARFSTQAAPATRKVAEVPQPKLRAVASR